MRDSNRCVSDSNRLNEIWILRQEMIRIRNSNIWIALSDLQTSAFTFAKGFESITRRFESPCLVLHNSRFKDSNRCVGDSNPCFNLFTCSLWGIWITMWVIRIGGSQLLFTRDSNLLIENSNRSISTILLEFGFKSFHEGFESPSPVLTF